MKNWQMTKSTWVSTNHSVPDVYIRCQGTNCNGVIVFNRQEITDRKNIGTNTSTPCRHCGWHPGYPHAVIIGVVEPPGSDVLAAPRIARIRSGNDRFVCHFDNDPVIGHEVEPSIHIAGACHDNGRSAK